MISLKGKSIDLTKFKVILLLNLVSLTALAGAQGNIGSTLAYSYHQLITVTVGPDFVKTGQAQKLTLYPPFQNNYTNSDEWKTVVDVGGFIGVEHPLNNWLFAQLGVSGYYDSNINPRGHVWLFAVPDFDTFIYKYTIQHARAMLAGKVLTGFSNFSKLKVFHPYFSWETGIAFNRAANYVETPIVSDVLPSAPFANHRQTSFTYGVGVGVDCAVYKHTRIGVGYQFADLGSASLGSTPAALTEVALNVSHLYTNQLRFQLTYLI